MDDLVRIGSTRLTATIAPLGAELRGLTTSGGHELLWSGDARWWKDRSPLLFPVIGRTLEQGVRIGGRRAPMPMHGFAKDRQFELVSQGPTHASWLLADDAGTRAIYPFAFDLAVDYSVEAEALTIAAVVVNRDSAPMPMCFGFHPGIRWPLAGIGPKEDYRLDFSEAEGSTVWRAGVGYILPDPVPNPMRGRELELRDTEFATGAWIFRDLRSRAVGFRCGDTTLLRVAFEGCANFGLWTKPGADFLCFEPWNGLPQIADFDGELADRPGIVRLAAGDTARMSMRIALGDGVA